MDDLFDTIRTMYDRFDQGVINEDTWYDEVDVQNSLNNESEDDE